MNPETFLVPSRISEVFVEKVKGFELLMNLDSSKVSGPDCIPVVVLKNCEPETVSLKFHTY